MSNWFSEVFDEFDTRGEAMFAFSRKQVEGKGVAWDDFQREWIGLGAGLHVKRSACSAFTQRLEDGQKAWQASLPELRVRYVGTNGYDYPLYRDEGGRFLVDISLNPPNEATELHTVTAQGEPLEALDVRPVYALGG